MSAISTPSISGTKQAGEAPAIAVQTEVQKSFTAVADRSPQGSANRLGGKPAGLKRGPDQSGTSVPSAKRQKLEVPPPSPAATAKTGTLALPSAASAGPNENSAVPVASHETDQHTALRSILADQKALYELQKREGAEDAKATRALRFSDAIADAMVGFNKKHAENMKLPEMKFQIH